jgi:hypothetical protein
MHIEWWAWMVGGIALVLAELAIASFYILWVGLGALLVGLVLWVMPDLATTTQLGLWTLASLAMLVLWFKVFKRGGGQSGIGLLVVAVTPVKRGRVRFQRPLRGSDEWVCLADQPIAAGERVSVVAVEGGSLKVDKV